MSTFELVVVCLVALASVGAAWSFMLTEVARSRQRRRLINGVAADRYGAWCAHGKHILRVDPDDTGPYPICRPAVPWPCDRCTLAEYERDMAAAADENEADRWAEYWAAQ